MIKLDDAFLAEIGLGGLPPVQRNVMLQKVFSRLEIQVGERLTSAMSPDELDSFGFFVDKDVVGMTKWFNENVPDYESTVEFERISAAHPEASKVWVMSEYGATKWLQINRPDYPQVVNDVFDDIKRELISHAAAIRAKFGGAAV